MPDFILSSFRREALAAENRLKLERILKTSPPLELVDPTSPAGRRALRGIPVAGGASGTSPGTDPLMALLDGEHRAWHPTISGTHHGGRSLGASPNIDPEDDA